MLILIFDCQLVSPFSVAVAVAVVAVVLVLLGWAFVLSLALLSFTVPEKRL